MVHTSELETNDAGATQSRISGAFHAIPGKALVVAFARYRSGMHRMRLLGMPGGNSLMHLGHVLDDDNARQNLEDAFMWSLIEVANASNIVNEVGVSERALAIGFSRIAQVRESGIQKYAFSNWREIADWSHINHAMRHKILHLIGDTSEDHLGHYATCLAFAVETFNQHTKYKSHHGPHAIPQEVPHAESVDAKQRTISVQAESAISAAESSSMQAAARIEAEAAAKLRKKMQEGLARLDFTPPKKEMLVEDFVNAVGGDELLEAIEKYMPKRPRLSRRAPFDGLGPLVGLGGTVHIGKDVGPMVHHVRNAT